MNRLALLLVLSAAACAGGRGALLVDPSLKAGTARVTRVALVPNRQPLTLSDPEKFRAFNWAVAAAELRQRGYEVTDYETSRQAFERASLPFDDTHSSRDKWAELAQALGVDAILVPSYATFAESRGAVILTTFSFRATTTLQIYLAERNEFVGRIEAWGESSYTTGILGTAGVAASLGAVALGADPGAAGLTSLLAVGADIALGLVLTARGSDAYWEEAFSRSIRDGLKGFAAAFPKG